jgi:porin
LGGGIARGADYDGSTQMVLQGQNKEGGIFLVNAVQIHGANLSANNLGVFQAVSGIEAERATRLLELWYQWNVFGDNQLTVRVGLQGLDQTVFSSTVPDGFMLSTYASPFINSTFGWPVLAAADLPGGGPAYPLSALGARLLWQPVNPVQHGKDNPWYSNYSVLAGLYNGNPASSASGDAQVENPSGTSFPLNGGVLAIAEARYSTGTSSPPTDNTYRLGLWYDSEQFRDIALDSLGRSLASPLSTGVARMHQGNYAMYAVVDQLLHQGANGTNALAGFARWTETPLQDRNVLSSSVIAGLTLKPDGNHTLGFGMGYTHVSAGATAFDRAAALFGDGRNPVRTREQVSELTYLFPFNNFIQLQADAQYVANPGAGMNPAPPHQHLGNEPVIGVRTIIAL